MNSLTVNQKELKLLFNSESVLKDIISFYEKEYYGKGEVICKVFLNDHPLSEEQESEFAGVGLSEITSVTLQTESPQKLVESVMKDWANGIPEIIKLCDSIASGIRLKGFETQITLFNHLLDACSFLASSLESVRTMRISQGLEVSGSWMDLEIEFTGTFSQLMDACQEKNESAIADIIEYDLASILQKWVNFLPQIGKAS